MKERKQQLRNPQQQRRHTLKYLYGLSMEQWHQMLIEQAGLCALCDEQMKSPQVDHSHATGVVRGMLCLRCNTMLGNAELVGIARIEAYLQRGFLVESSLGISSVWEAVYCGFLSSSYN